MTTEMRLPREAEIRAFWEWFVGVAPELARSMTDEKILRDLDEHVAQLGAISWEIGPGTTSACSLSITPDGDLDALSITRRIVSLAPSINGWEIHAARPPKQWDLRFTMDAGDRKIDVDGRRWKYVLYEYPDGVYDVVIAAPELASLAEPLRVAAAEIVLDGMLGEALRLEHVADIEIVKRLPRDQAENASDITDIGHHFARLVRS